MFFLYKVNSRDRMGGLFLDTSNGIPTNSLIATAHHLSPEFAPNSRNGEEKLFAGRKRRKRGLIIDYSNGLTNNGIVRSNSTKEYSNPDLHVRRNSRIFQSSNLFGG